MRLAPVVPGAVLLVCVGCATVRPVQQPEEFITRVAPTVVYVTFKNHSKVALNQPHVSRDSLFGTVTGVSSPLAAPLSHVQRVDAKQHHKGRTVWLIAGLAVAMGSGIWAMSQTGGGTSCDYSIPGTFTVETEDHCN